MPGTFALADYRQVQRRLGLRRAVVVQPNAYQTDNSVALAALGELGTDARGVAVAPLDVADAELALLTDAGFVAQRIFALPNGAMGFESMTAIMARVHPFGWHANIQLDGRTLPQHEAQIRALPGRFVIDHVGKFLEPVSVDHPAFVCLLRLLDTGRCWVKLAAPYEVSHSGAPRYEDVGALARRLVEHAPERMLWASNWPHQSAKPALPDDADLLDLLLDWAPDSTNRAKILVDNPAMLYGFSDVGATS